MAVTITEVARKSGKSIATVSHILRGGAKADLYRPQTREAVLQAAKDLGFRPNLFASQLQKQNRRVIMLGFTSLKDIFAATIADEFGRAASERGYTIFSAALASDESVAGFQNMLGSHGILALALIGDATTARMNDEALLRLVADGVQIVTIGRTVASDAIGQVLYDDDSGVRQALDYLLDQGIRSLWMVGGSTAPNADGVYGRRQRETQRYLQERAPSVEVRRFPLTSGEGSEGSAAFCELLRSEALPDAIVCPSDPIAWTVKRLMADAGLQPGRDLALIGYNDNEPSALMTPSITTVRIPMADLGRQAATLLLDSYESETGMGTIELPTDLIIRESGRTRSAR